MNLLADECIDQQIVERLRQDGHEVLYIAEMDPGISDDIVLSQASERHALLVKADKDFGELVFRLNQIHAGVVLSNIMSTIVLQIPDIILESHQ
jgi:predicted nuclease of predicted toxin-antitoxin system